VFVAGVHVGPEQVQVLPAADARHQLDAEEVRQPEDRGALPVGVGMHRGWLQQRAVLGHEVEDGVALVGAAGQEAREQGDVGIGHEIVADAAIAAVADVVGGFQAFGMHVPLHAVGGGGVAGAPVPVQADAGVGVDHAGDGVIQVLLRDVALVGEGHVSAVQTLEGARRLAWAKTAAVAEGGGKVALARTVQLGLKARDRAEVPGPAQPVLGVGKRIQDAGWDHTRLEQPFQEGRAIDGLPRPQPLHHGFAGHDLDVFVLWESLIGGVGRLDEAGFQHRDKGAGVGRDAGLLGVACDCGGVGHERSPPRFQVQPLRGDVARKQVPQWRDGGRAFLALARTAVQPRAGKLHIAIQSLE